MRTRMCLAMVLLLGLCLSIVGVASAWSGDPDQPKRLSNTVPRCGVLEGNRGSAFSYYEFPCPGDGSDVTVSMLFEPDDPVTGQGMGFVIYGPSGEVARGQRAGRSGKRKVTFFSAEGGTYLVQVYDNYIEGATLHYTRTR